MSKAQSAEVSDEQAADALRTLLGDSKADTAQKEAEDTVIRLIDGGPADETPAEEEVEEEAAEAPAAPQKEKPEPTQTDDVAALKASLEEMQKRNESVTAQAKKSLQWAKERNDLALRKSTEADRLAKFLEQVANKGEVDREEIQRVLGGQQIAFQPQPIYQQPVQQATQEVDFNAAMDEQMFLLDHPMTQDGYDSFHKFIQTANIPEAFVPGNTYATLSRFHRAFSEQSAGQSKEMARAAKSVQRTQTQARRAAGSISGRGNPSPPPERPKDLSQMSPKEIEGTPGLLGELFRRSIEG